MKDISQPKKLLKPMECHQQVLENGLVKTKSDSSLLQEDIENTMFMMSKNSLVLKNVSPMEIVSSHCDMVLSTPESLAKNKNMLETCKDKLKLLLQGIPITRSYQMSGLVSISSARDSYPYWTEYKKDLFQRLLLPIESDCVDSHLIWSNTSVLPMEHPSWFLTRTTKNNVIQIQNSLKTSSLSPLFSSVDITEEGDIVKTFLSDKLKEFNKTQTRSINCTLNKRLVNKKSKEEQALMSIDEYASYKEEQKSQRESLRHQINSNKVIRTRLYRLYGSREQFQFLKQQRGICRHLYNLCLADIKNHYEEHEELLNKSILRKKYQPDEYWKENDKEWALLAPSNLRTAVIEQLHTNITTALKSGKQFDMKYISKKQDRFHYSIPVSVQQIGKNTCSMVFEQSKLPELKPITKRKNKKSKTKNSKKKIRKKEKQSSIQKQQIIFQYMSTKCPNKGNFVIRIHKKDNFPTNKSEFEHDVKLVYKTGSWYVALSYDVDLPPEPSITTPKICSIDPGIKTALTVYDVQDGSITEIGTTKDSLERIKNKNKTLSSHARLERLRRRESRIQSQISLMKKEVSTRKEKRRIVRIQRGLDRTREKKKNLIREFHYKTVKYLVSNYDIILMPYFNTQHMAKRTGDRKLRRRSVRAMQDWNFSMLRQRLIWKAETQGKTWLEVGEAYTTRDCVQCGKSHKITLKDRIFNCKQCGLRMLRDWHSAISIFVKNASLQENHELAILDS